MTQGALKKEEWGGGDKSTPTFKWRMKFSCTSREKDQFIYLEDSCRCTGVVLLEYIDRILSVSSISDIRLS